MHAEKWRADGATAERIEQALREGTIFPSAAWCETAKAMGQVLVAMRQREKPAELVTKEADALVECRLDWTASWIRNELTTYFRNQSSTDTHASAHEVASRTAKELVDKAVSDHANLRYNGGWFAFDAELVAEQIISEVKTDYRIRLGAKATRNIEGCLRTASANQGRAMVDRMTDDEKQTLRARLPNLSEKAFEPRPVTTESLYLLNAKKLDKKRSKPYWGTDLELLARAGEQYVFYTMKENGCQSDYLVHGVEESRFASENVVGNPYPAGAERGAIAIAMKSLIESGCEVIRERALDLAKKAKPDDLGMAA